MKKMVLASAFALIGTLAFGQNRTCSSVKNDCGIALILCWYGELDPDKAKEAASKACEEEQEVPTDGE